MGSKACDSAERPGGREASREEIPLSFPKWCVLVCLGAVMEVSQFLLWVLRPTTKAESSGLGVSVGGILGWQSSYIWYRVACLP